MQEEVFESREVLGTKRSIGLKLRLKFLLKSELEHGLDILRRVLPSRYIPRTLWLLVANSMLMRRTDLEELDSRQAALARAYLSGTNLMRANLMRANLAGVYLRGANLIGARLAGADLRGADLIGADLMGADLVGARLAGADLRGADLRGARMHKEELFDVSLLSINIYISESNPILESRLEKAVEELAKEFEFSTVDSLPVRGSWFKQWVLKIKKVASQENVAERLEKMELAFEQATLKRSEANINKTQAEAVAALLKELKDVSSGVLQVGSILVVKLNDVPFVRSLSRKEIVILEEHPDLLRNPNSILDVFSDSRVIKDEDEPDIFNNPDSILNVFSNSRVIKDEDKKDEKDFSPETVQAKPETGNS